jgi:hypothetical protein
VASLLLVSACAGFPVSRAPTDGLRVTGGYSGFYPATAHAGCMIGYGAGPKGPAEPILMYGWSGDNTPGSYPHPMFSIDFYHGPGTYKLAHPAAGKSWVWLFGAPPQGWASLSGSITVTQDDGGKRYAGTLVSRAMPPFPPNGTPTPAGALPVDISGNWRCTKAVTVAAAA